MGDPNPWPVRARGAGGGGVIVEGGTGGDMQHHSTTNCWGGCRPQGRQAWETLTPGWCGCVLVRGGSSWGCGALFYFFKGG